MKITEPYSPTPRANARAKPVRSAGDQRRQDHPHEGAHAAGAEGGGGLLDLAVDLVDHRLHGADHEGQADEDQRQPDAERGVGDLDPEVRGEGPSAPFGA